MTTLTADRGMKCALAALTGLVEATGLGTSHIHLRVNAVQINNAFRAFVHEPWTRDLTERQALARIVEMIRTVKPDSVNFETLDLETATAIRQFALAAQIVKHVDRDTPIRYLIAECESPATILIAVFFAKLFGVERIVDISPLFETPAALETGPRLIERLLAEEAYRDYVRGRGRLCVQTGYSDAGRFIGQIAAGLAHERLHFGLADVVHKANLPGVETLIFSTHGESMGRGAHPGPLRRRLRYVLSGEARWRFFRHALPVKHETSFQGGDGYLFFANREFATRALATIIMSGKDPGEGEDPFYTDVNLSLDFQLRLQGLPAGSLRAPRLSGAARRVRRQPPVQDRVAPREAPGRARVRPRRPRPHARDPQQRHPAAVRLRGERGGGPRRRRRLGARALRRARQALPAPAHPDRDDRARQADLEPQRGRRQRHPLRRWLLGAARLLGPRASATRRPSRRLPRACSRTNAAGAINGLAHHLRLDAIELHSILEDIGLEGGKIPDDHRLELDLLQAIRLALIMRIFILAAQLPRFTPTNEVSYDQIFQSALGLEIPDGGGSRAAGFPAAASRRARRRGLRRAGDLPAARHRRLRPHRDGDPRAHGGGLRVRARDRHRHLAPLGRLRLENPIFWRAAAIARARLLRFISKRRAPGLARRSESPHFLDRVPGARSGVNRALHFEFG